MEGACHPSYPPLALPVGAATGEDGETLPWQLLSHAQRRRKLEQLRSATRQEKQRQQEEDRLADEQATRNAKTTIDDEEEDLIDIIDEPVVLPYSVDPSHKVLYFGGFAACTRCGTMASTSSARNAIFPEQCLGFAACSTANRSRLRRLQRGEHPRPDRHSQWPDGTPAGEQPRRPTVPRIMEIHRCQATATTELRYV